MAISILIGAPVFICIFWHFDFDKDKIKEISKFMPIVFPLGILVDIIIKPLVKNIKIYDDNSFFIDPISNTAIEEYVKKITKRKMVVIHITELDRLSNEIGKKGAEAIKYIVKSISLAYKNRNVNIVFEIDSNIKNIVATNSSGDKTLKDKVHKLFGEIMDINTFDYKSILKLDKFFSKGKDEGELFYSYFKMMKELNSKSHIMSWRLIDKHIKIFRKVNEKVFQEDSVKKEIYLKGSYGFQEKQGRVNWGFNEMYKSEIMSAFSFEKEDETKIFFDNGIKAHYGEDAENYEDVWKQIFSITNPHLRINIKDWKVYEDLWNNLDFQKEFFNNYSKFLKEEDAFKNNAVFYFIYFAKQYYPIDGKFNLGSFWKSEWQIIQDEKYITKKDYFNKILPEYQQKLVEGLSPENIKGQKWFFELSSQYLDSLNGEVVIWLLNGDYIEPVEVEDKMDLSDDYWYTQLAKKVQDKISWKPKFKILNDQKKYRKDSCEKIDLSSWWPKFDSELFKYIKPERDRFSKHKYGVSWVFNKRESIKMLKMLLNTTINIKEIEIELLKKSDNGFTISKTLLFLGLDTRTRNLRSQVTKALNKGVFSKIKLDEMIENLVKEAYDKYDNKNKK
ncbi:hypothetical protein C4B24_04775 [Mycoplasma marinum]|uniref:Uncharacterized protein n=1 Tax=Mycoplasma marinum TaxID=1937190 RepID=A0A4R0XPU3_9MOLU|nr:hypothetical protein C4B24_04775 [Mycoplasma marinum]